MNDEIRSQFLGGCDQVGNLAMVLELGGMKLLFDYGMAPGKPPSFPLPPPLVDLTFLTHAHLDHSGMIPWLCAQADQTVLGTQITGELMTLLQKDTVKIAQMDGYSVPFTNTDVRNAEHSYISVDQSKKRELGDDYLVRYHSAGHIPGSLMYELVGDKKIVFTGDLNVVDTRLVEGTKPVPCDILFMEGTYAGREHTKRNVLEKAFLDKIDDVVKRGGVAVVPSFALARSQEILLVLKNAGYDIWFDGMGKKIAKIFLRYPRYVRSVEDLRKALKKTNMVHSEHGRKMALKSEVIITSSGMMDGGPVLWYMNHLKADKKSAVLLTGYQVEGTNCHLLMEKHQLNFYGVREPIACEVEYFDFSAHAGHSELIQFAKSCHPEKVVLCHSDNREPLVGPLQEFTQVLTPKKGEVFTL